MLQSHHLSKLLPVALIFLCVHAGGFGLSQVRRISQQGVGRQSRESLATIYRGETGVHEQGNNEGTRVEEYLKYVKLEKGQAWCAAFVCWALGKAGLQNPRSGWSPRLFPESKVIWRRSRQMGVNLPGQSTTSKPQQGDVFGIYFPDKVRIAHCGFIDRWSGSWALTVEGNTNLAGSREGDGVYHKRRLIGSLFKVSDWVGK